MNPIQFKQLSSGRGIGSKMHSAVSIAFLSTLFAAAAVGTFSMSELPSLGGGTTSLANGINDRGDVVGRSYTADLSQHATIWLAGGAPADLGVLPGGMMSDAAAVSSSGVIVGTTVMDAPDNYANHATLWSSATSAPVYLASLGGWNSQAAGINTAGDIVGYSHVPDNSTMHATFWPAAGHAPHDLGTLSGGTYSEAAAINTAGDIVGLGEDGFMNTQAVLWPAVGRVPVVLQSLGGRYNRAYGISDNGDIVGMSQDANGYSHATLWPAAGRLPVDLGTVGGTFGTASGINAAGDIVGVSTDVSGYRHATVWAGTGAGTVPSTCKSGGSSRSRSDHSERSEHSNRSDRSDHSDRRRVTTASALAPVSAAASVARVPFDLGLLPGGSSSQASGVNASGQVVGFGENSSWENRAMSWKSLSTTPPPAPGGTPGRDHEGNHQNEGDEDGDC